MRKKVTKANVFYAARLKKALRGYDGCFYASR